MKLAFVFILVRSVAALGLGTLVLTRSWIRVPSKPARSSHQRIHVLRTLTICMVGLVGSVIGIYLTASLVGALLGPLAAILVALSGQQRLRKQHSSIIDRWPTVLEDIRIQVGTMGTPLPQAFFLAVRRHRLIEDTTTEEAERAWLLGGSFEQALEIVGSQLIDDASHSALLSLTLCFRDGGNDIASRIEDLREAREADRQLWREMNARLGSVRVARAFVVVVPIVMGVLGYLLGGSNIRDYQGIGGIGVGIAAIVVVLCWIWSSALMAPPLVRTQRRSSSGAKRRTSTLQGSRG